MCGIAGWLGSLPDAPGNATAMARALCHRGPDGFRVQSFERATLVHTRLSIIDPSPAGSQPMANEDETVWVVFNGEVYNHRELRRDLEARGHIFRGRCDAEVIPHLYEEDGANFVTRLRGMFALVIYDTRSRALLLARDRFGIKPLFFAAGKDQLVFASELQALLRMPRVDLRPDRQAISDFAALLYIPAPQTFYTGIRAVQPGEIIEARLEAARLRLKKRLYHQWTIAPNPELTVGQAVEQVDALLTTAVDRQLESDVPLGALLSGGIDSALVSAAAQRATTGALQTFNVHFADEEYDETWAATAVAEQIGSAHRTLDMDETEGTWDHVTALLLHTGQPFADTSLFAVNAVCRLMRRYVTVALSGDGGDEGFGGYNLYWQIARIARWQSLPQSVRKGSSWALAPLAYLGIIAGRLPQRLKEFASADDTSVVQNLFCWLREEEHRHLCRESDVLPVRRLFERRWEHRLPPKASRIERLSALATEANIRLSLANDYLFKVDTASMRESLEVRVPMLDEDLFDFALSVSHRLKVRGRTCKRVLRAMAERHLPRAVAKKPKRGFGVPVDTWVGSAFKKQLKDVLLGPSSRLPEVFRPEAYRSMLEAFCEGRPHPNLSREGLYQRAVMMLSVQLTLSQAYGDHS